MKELLDTLPIKQWLYQERTNELEIVMDRFKSDIGCQVKEKIWKEFKCKIFVRYE